MASGGLPPTHTMPPPRGWTPGASPLTPDPAQSHNDATVANQIWEVNRGKSDKNRLWKSSSFVLTLEKAKLYFGFHHILQIFWIFFFRNSFKRLLRVDCNSVKSVKMLLRVGAFWDPTLLSKNWTHHIRPIESKNWYGKISVEYLIRLLNFCCVRPLC